MAGELRESYPNLCKLLVMRTTPGSRPSILAVAVHYYFRREVETDPELFRGLAITKLGALEEAQEQGRRSCPSSSAGTGRRRSLFAWRPLGSWTR
jgi:hypothetical protein